MSHIDQLLLQHCSEGVEFCAIGEIADVGTGSSDRKDAIDGGAYPFYVRSQTILRTDQFEFDEDAIVIPGEGGIGEIFHFVSGKYALHQRAYRISFRTSRLDPKFAFYYFSVHFKKFILMKAVSATVTSIRKPMITEFRIPLPPLPVQREIVRLLDDLTHAEAELEKELEAELRTRRQQYVHYRDQLVVSGLKTASERTLGELAKVARGSSPRPIQAYLTDDPNGVPWIKIGDVPAGGKFITSTAQRVTEAGAARSRVVRPGDFVLTNSMSFGRPYITKIEGCIHDGWLAISEFGEHYLPDYLYHLLSSTPVQRDFEQRVGSSTVSNLNSETVKATLLPVPSLDEQARIVGVLDEFDVLVNDLSIGLPAELAARRKQYEYYRDKLLTFEELV